MKRLSAAIAGLALPFVAAASPGTDASPPLPGAVVSVAIEWSWKAPSKLPVQGEVVLTPSEVTGAPLRLAIESQKSVQVHLPAGSKWEAAASIAGYWVQRKDFTVDLSPSKLVLDLWPLGTVSGSLKVKDQGAPLPQRILVKTLAAPSYLKRPRVPPGAMDCPVDRKGGWTCSLPAATFDLAISAEGFTPIYLTGVTVLAGEPVRLGQLELARGASLAAWVAVDDGVIEPGRCTAQLSPRVSAMADLAKSENVARLALVREIRQDGLLQLTGLAPGVYSLEVRQPGYSPARVDLVRVEPGTETFLRDPLILRRPLDLEVELSPPLDWLGRTWRARVSRIDAGVRVAPIVFDGAADADGRFVVPNQSAGQFRISVLDSLGNSLHSDSSVVVDGPATAHQVIQIEVVDFAGRVRLGDDPLAAVLWFGGRSGAISVKVEADQEGAFFGVLPRAGRWLVEVEAAEPRLRTRVWAEVRASRSGKASVDLQLPDTRVFGRVVGEDGKPVPGAYVAVQGASIEQLTEADGEGLFELRALPEGFAWLGAEAASRMSDRVGVTLSEGAAVGPIELRLRAVERLGGSVTSRLGPVAGAQVELMVPAPEGGDSATTGLDGTFSVEIPKGARQAIAMVAAPGFALRMFNVALEAQSIVLQVSEEGGTLEVALSDQAVETLHKDNLGFVVRQNGLPIPPVALQRWAQHQGQASSTGERSLRIPNLAPGEYRACLVPRQLPFLASEAVLAAANVRCDTGTLSPGGTLSLKPVR